MTAEMQTETERLATPAGNPWERRERLGFWPALLETIGGMVVAPRATLAATRERGGLVGPLLFAFIVALLAGLSSELVEGAIALGLGQKDGTGLLRAFALEIGGRSFTWLPLSLASIGAVLLALLGLAIGIPVFAIVYSLLLLAWSGLVHLCLLAVGALRSSPSGYHGTFRGTCFSQVALFAAILPVIGEPLALVWLVALQVAAWMRFHGTGPARAAVATLLPLMPLAVLVLLALFLGEGGN